jgi:hypothetical protein
VSERGILFSERAIKAAATRMGVDLDVYRTALQQGAKVCGGCKKAKPRTAEHFSVQKRGDGLRSKCRECEAAVEKAHYWRTHTQQREQQLAYQRANRDRLYAYNAKWQRTRNKALRAELIAAYGGACACCGEREPNFLDLDHVHNNGAEHRREVGNNTQVMLALKRAGWPKDDYQLLCCNCNQGKARNGGVCPHAKKAS